jgi:hypothetical protein
MFAMKMGCSKVETKFLNQIMQAISYISLQHKHSITCYYISQSLCWHSLKYTTTIYQYMRDAFRAENSLGISINIVQQAESRVRNLLTTQQFWAGTLTLHPDFQIMNRTLNHNVLLWTMQNIISSNTMIHAQIRKMCLSTFYAICIMNSLSVLAEDL